MQHLKEKLLDLVTADITKLTKIFN